MRPVSAVSHTRRGSPEIHAQYCAARQLRLSRVRAVLSSSGWSGAAPGSAGASSAPLEWSVWERAMGAGSPVVWSVWEPGMSRRRAPLLCVDVTRSSGLILFVPKTVVLCSGPFESVSACVTSIRSSPFPCYLALCVRGVCVLNVQSNPEYYGTTLTVRLDGAGRTGVSWRLGRVTGGLSVLNQMPQSGGGGWIRLNYKLGDSSIVVTPMN
ncbi:hypothetical protein FJT64_002760 [Amphibalanus amphitrite]|uniref:Uncharacterized protein n=1 Tax=Amphibalanus amphitrite TaxID=1232801 RepID=A0A6A4WL76_AMPAM|nr:hypothetical protein FJT64_002760 [Amphibalanus amphitrite]